MPAARNSQPLVISDDDDGPLDGQREIIPGGGREADIGNDTVSLPQTRRQANEAEDQFEAFDPDAGEQTIDETRRPAERAAPEQDERIADEGDERTGQDGRQRQSRAQRRAIQKDTRLQKDARLMALDAEVQELRSMVQGFQPRFSELDEVQRNGRVQDLDRQIQVEADRGARALNQVSEAMVNSDGPAHAAAMKEYTAAVMKGQQLQVNRNMMATGNPTGDPQGGGGPMVQRGSPQQPQVQQQRPVPLRPVAQAYKTQFMEQHSWFKPGGADLDSRVLTNIDNDITAEGYDPATPAYWDELSDRAGKYLPHRFNGDGAQDGEDDRPARTPARANGNGAGNGNGQSRQQQAAPVQQQRRGPMVGGGSDRSSGGGPTKVNLNAGRKAALIQQNVLSQDGRTVLDQSKFQRLLKQFHEFDVREGLAG